MTSKLKCPFCGEELIMEHNRDRDTEIYHCDNCYFQGDGIIWHALIQTQKDLEIARLALDWVYKNYYLRAYAKGLVEKALEQIEHKE